MLQPIGFLCDHIEILYDVDRLFADYAFKLGIRLERPESLNESTTLARAVAELAVQGLTRLSNPSANDCSVWRVAEKQS
jgi:ferrochelatase